MQSDYLRYSTPDRDDGVDTVQANLAEIDKRHALLCLERAFHLGELTQELAQSPSPDKETLSAISERLFVLSQDHTPYQTATYYADLVTLCTEIAHALPNGYAHFFTELFGDDVPLSNLAKGRVAYVANSYTEQAFLLLCNGIADCRVSYHHHFDDVCQDVYNGGCQYGILPIQSSDEGMLAGLYRLVARYKLKICAVCRVAGAKDGYTMFALVKRSQSRPQTDTSSCLDFLFTPADVRQISDLLCVAGLFGHHVLHTGSFTSHDGETFRLCMMTNPHTLYPFLVYLTLFCTDVTPIGLYKFKS